MNETLGVPLTISCEERASLGPLNVEIIPEGGDPVKFVLTSGRPQHAVHVLPGRYAVIARSPNGEHLCRSVVVTEGVHAAVRLVAAIPQSSNSTNEIMRPESQRSDIAAGEALEPSLTSATRAPAAGTDAIERRLTLRVWTREGTIPSNTPPNVYPEHDAAFLKLRLDRKYLAIGLVDETGFGPIVIAPPFQKPLHIRFLAEGVAFRLAARYPDHSGQQAPLAQAIVAEPRVNDLLIALSAPAVEEADAIWEQNFGSLAKVADTLNYLLNKCEDPAAALLCAHYLLRFLPDKLPLSCADKLVLVEPTAADGPVIAAWLRLLSNADDVRALHLDEIDRDVHRLLTEALSRPTALFARTRLLLADGVDLQNGNPAARSPQRAYAHPTEFLNYGARAGGLDSFLGTSPYSPGSNAHGPKLPGLDILDVRLRGSIFTGTVSRRSVGRRRVPAAPRPMDYQYDRTAEDLGNIVGLEYVNLAIPNQGLASEFYLMGLGLTRDPYMFPGTNNMWVNIGKSQFHLPTRHPQVLRGHVGLVVPSLDDLSERLGEAKKKLAETKFDCKQHNQYLEATCPWGNKFRLYEPDTERFGWINLGMPYVEFTVPEGTADGIARFYREILCTSATIKENGEGRAAHICVGHRQELIFREAERALPEYDGHYLQVYVQEFSGPHDQLEKHGLITEESDQYQYRFQDIVCLETGKRLFTVEHEIRSCSHPLYNRKLVNRNPLQSERHYQRGADEWDWTLPRSTMRVQPTPAPEPLPLARRRAARMAAM